MLDFIKCRLVTCEEPYRPEDDPKIQAGWRLSERIDRFIEVDERRKTVATPIVSDLVRSGMRGKRQWN